MKRDIEQDQTIERTELALNSVILSDNKIFKAASINVYATKFEFKDKKIMFLLAILIGLIIGAFYVIISKAIQSHMVIKKKIY
jgi:hypothetical protein